jgi:hypothetical protein
MTVKIHFIDYLDLSVLVFEQEDKFLFHRLLCGYHLVMDLFDHNYSAVFQVACPLADLMAAEPEDNRLADLVVMVDNNNLVAVEVVDPDSILLSLELHNVLELYNIP